MRGFFASVIVCAAASVDLCPIIAPAAAQSVDTLADLNRMIMGHYRTGNYADAIPLAERYVGLARKRYGEKRPEFATALNNLAELYREQARYAEAEPLHKRALAIREKALAADDPAVGVSLNNLALLYGAQGRHAEAEQLYKRVLAIRQKALPAGHPDIAQSINDLGLTYREQGRYAEAEPLYKKALAMREKVLPAGHRDIATSLNNVAGIYQDQGRYAEAEPLYQRALEMREKALPQGHPHIALSLNNLAFVNLAQGRLGDAEQLFKRALDMEERALPVGHPDIALCLSNLAGVYGAQGRFAEAEPLFQRSLEMRQKGLPPGHPDIANSFHSLASLYETQGRFVEAESHYKRALALREKSLPPGHVDIANSVNSLASLYETQGRLAEAEPLYKRALEMREKALPAGHPDVAGSLNNLAYLYKATERFAEAEPLYKRALTILETAFPAGNRDISGTLDNLAALYEAQDRLAEAEPLYKRALANSERVLPAGHPKIANSLNNLGLLYDRQGRMAEAEPLLQRALALRERALPAGHPDTAVSVNNVAGLYLDQHRLSEAEALYQRALAMREKALPAGHPALAVALGNLAAVSEDREDWATANGLLVRSTDILIARAKRSPSGSKNDATRGAGQFKALIKVAHRLAEHDASRRAELSAETFTRAQWAMSSEAAATLAQMVARGAKGDQGLARLVRERQDLAAEWQSGDKTLVAASAMSPERRNSATEQALRERQTAIQARLATIDGTLAQDFPDYAALSQPEPASIADVQLQLRPDEALVLILDTWASRNMPEETFLWLVTKTDSRWVRSSIGSQALREAVTALRCGLDESSWMEDGEARCRQLLQSKYSLQGSEAKALPFDLARAHALYKGLFGEIEDLIKDKHLLLVPSGPLSQLPFQVLVTSLPNVETSGLRRREVGRVGAELRGLSNAERAQAHLSAGQGVWVVRAQPSSPAETAGIKPGDILLAVGGVAVTAVNQAIETIRTNPSGANVAFRVLRDGAEFDVIANLGGTTIQEWIPRYLGTSDRNVQWLARSHALTVLPAVSSLQALRRVAKPSGATKPIIGFGNPLLDGDQKDPQFGAYYRRLAEQARAHTGCAAASQLRTASLRGGVRPVATRGKLAEVADLKLQVPLPETADELCVVARAVGGNDDDIYLGERASERAVKALSKAGQLARYRILHFATHGTLAGELSGTTEPGLILTPPSEATEEDDGYLSASEIATLNLDADWVILSACNTAGSNGAAAGAEALSGLARAFFYAQARALLVSHWAVNSDATVKLITAAVNETARDSKVGRAEALRRAMLSLIDNGEVHEVHPAYWAPFVVVGEGGATR